jgi:RNA polymerase sigma-70 factor (ECF subfamily)
MVSQSDSDEVLMEAYVAGDRSAFDVLFHRHAPVVLGLMRRHVRSDDEAKELLQQTFLLLHRARLDYRHGAALKPWLFTIAMNCVRGHHRSKGRRREAELTPEIESSLVSSDPPPEAIEESRRARERLRRALARLPDGQREVIELHWFQGRPFQEIADILGASLSAVKVRAHRGYARLRALLEEEMAR